MEKMPRAQGTSKEASETDAYRFGEILEYVLNEQPPQDQYPEHPEGLPDYRLVDKPHETEAAQRPDPQEGPQDDGTIVVRARWITSRVPFEISPAEAVQPARRLLRRIATNAADFRERLRVGPPPLRVATIQDEAFRWKPITCHERVPVDTVIAMTCIETLYAAFESQYVSLTALFRPRAPFVTPEEYTQRMAAFQGAATQWRQLPWELRVVLAAEELYGIITREGYQFAQCAAPAKGSRNRTKCKRWIVSFPARKPRTYCDEKCRARASYWRTKQ